MEKENLDLNEIVTSQNIIKDKSLSEKIELKLQKDNKITIPSIIIELTEEQTGNFQMENLFSFFNHFGEVLNINIVNGEKKAIILFKTFFIAIICKKFLENERQFKEGKKCCIKVRWFDFEKDSNLLLREDIKTYFETIYYKNIVNIKPEFNNANNNLYKNFRNNNNNIGINMNMKINNYNINTTINSLGQSHNPLFPNVINNMNNNFGLNNINNLPNIQQQQLMMKMNKNNLMPNIQGMPNINPLYLMQIAQAQNALKNNMILNNKNNLNNFGNNNDINTQKNSINNINNNILNKNIQMQLLQNQMKNMNLIQNANINPNINPNLKNMNNNINNPPNNINDINDEKNFGKYTCKYEILIANDKDFQIARRLIGSKGCNMKNIINGCKSGPNDSDNVKLRLRGKGSGYKEGPDNKESDEPLHLCISSKNPEDMKKACLLVDDLLNKVHNDYKDYCQKNNITPENTEIAMRIESKNLGYNGK